MVIIFKSCSKCGKIHDTNYVCKANYKYEVRNDKDLRKLRSTSAWTNKSIQIKKDSKYLCAICLEEGVYNYNNLEVHHIEKLRDNKDKLLDDDNLICLCKEHHIQADNGTISKEHLLDLVEKRKNNNLVN